MPKSSKPWSIAMQILREDDFEVTPKLRERIEFHWAWIRQWNDVAGFVSKGEETTLEEHALDSLSLVPYLAGAGSWLDIGSGGGFPAIPAGVLLSDVRLSMIERSEKKAGLLISLVAKLGMANAAVIVGSFPQIERDWVPEVVTARAVERPERVHKHIAHLVENGAAFLCQSDPTWWHQAMFHVEQINDRWTEAGLRRGKLYRITRT